MPRRFGDQHRENMKRVKAETKALKKGKTSHSGGMRKRCGQCSGTGQMQSNRILRRSGAGTCTRCGGDGLVDL